MPAIGTKHRSDSNLLVTTKIYGPTNKFMFDPKDVLDEVKRITDSEGALSPKNLASEIASEILEKVDYDPNVVWVECEVLQADGIFFTGSAYYNDSGDSGEEATSPV